MPRIDLVLNYQPSVVEVFIAYKRTDGIFIPSLGILDTGAELSLFPIGWLKSAEHTIIQAVSLGQAGIAKQAFDAVEAEIIVHLEDLRVRAWFAETDKIIIGFQDILDRAILHVDYLQSRTGYIELQDNSTTSS
jgi:hypothetical protein